MEAIISNIKIIDMFKLSKELNGYIQNTVVFIAALKGAHQATIHEEHVLYILNQSEHITFDVVKNDFKKHKDEEQSMYIRSSIENGMIVNKLGLTEYEMWYNTLSDKEKEFVELLSNNNFSNLPFC